MWSFLDNGECFDINNSSGCVYPTLYIMRLLGRVYALSSLICYHCWFNFHALMLVVLWEWKFSLLNDIGKDYKVNTDFDKILTFSVARILDLVLSRPVKSELKTPVMGIVCHASFEKDCFDILRSIRFWELDQTVFTF